MPTSRRARPNPVRRATLALCLSAAALLVPAGATLSAASLPLSAAGVDDAVPSSGAYGTGDPGETTPVGAPTAAETANLQALLAQEAGRIDASRAAGDVAGLVARLHGGAELAQAGRLGASPQAIVALSFALSQRGKPYLWGGTGPDAWDCSGLTQASYRAAGVTVPRVAEDQARIGQAVPLSGLLPGDLVFFAYDPVHAAGIHHVAMYLGNGLIVHAPKTGDVVKVSRLWLSDYAGAVRPTSAVGGGITSVGGIDATPYPAFAGGGSGTPAGVLPSIGAPGPVVVPGTATGGPAGASPAPAVPSAQPSTSPSSPAPGAPAPDPSGTPAPTPGTPAAGPDPAPTGSADPAPTTPPSTEPPSSAPTPSCPPVPTGSPLPDPAASGNVPPETPPTAISPTPTDSATPAPTESGIGTCPS